MNRKFEGEFRPWGNFKTLAKNEKCTVKIITVRPGETLSLQYHNKRDEYWAILSGSGRVIIRQQDTQSDPFLWKRNVGIGDELFIPKKFIHNVEADDEPLVLLEISYGEFDENDIVRLSDKYKR